MPVSTSSGPRAPAALCGWMLPPRHAIDIGARTSGLVKRSSPTTSIGVLHKSAPRTTRRSFIPTSADRANTIRKANLAQPSDLDQLHDHGLHGTAKAFIDVEAGGGAASLGHAEWLAPLLEREACLQSDKRLSKRLHYAKPRHQACVEDIDYRTPRDLDRGPAGDAGRTRLDRCPRQPFARQASRNIFQKCCKNNRFDLISKQ